MFPHRPEYGGQKSNPAPPRNRVFARAILIAALCCPLPVLALWGAVALSNSLSVPVSAPSSLQNELSALHQSHARYMDTLYGKDQKLIDAALRQHREEVRDVYAKYGRHLPREK